MTKLERQTIVFINTQIKEYHDKHGCLPEILELDVNTYFAFLSEVNGIYTKENRQPITGIEEYKGIPVKLITGGKTNKPLKRLTLKNKKVARRFYQMRQQRKQKGKP